MSVDTRHTNVETFQLGPFTVPRIWTGLWQLSSNAWGSASVSQIRQSMAHHVADGYTAFDMVSDHYGSSEIIFGQFRRDLPNTSRVIGATKWCVFKQITPTREVVAAALEERMQRMHISRIDLLQFHWANYQDKGYLTALTELDGLKREGLIASLGLCNFDALHTDEICTVLGSGVIVSNQVQFSLIDTRPLHGMIDVCKKHNLKLLTYGTLAGGFISDAWYHQQEPDAYTGLTPSQRKYLDMIKTWGSWTLFQALLGVLRTIADQHDGLSIANIATRWVLDHDCVGAVIIGARLGLSEHTADNLKVFGWTLSKQERTDIEDVLARSNGSRMITTIGDCGSEYR